jgi:glycosyltransferase involved in cell wall biosynthesis
VKIIQVPFCFYPDPVGGTEIYVEALSRQLQSQGLDILIASPGLINQAYQHHQIPVHRFAVSPQISDLRNLYGNGDPLAALEFSRILDRERPDLVHLHAFTTGVSLRIVKAAKQRNIPVVFTYHTPTISCQRGTLLRGGTEICNGKLDVPTCTRCTLQGLGLDRLRANLIGSLPTVVGKGLGSLGLQGGVWTALRMSDLINCHQIAFHQLMIEVDQIVAVCNWVKALLLLNQVSSDKISMIRQGLCHDRDINITTALAHSTDTLRIVFLGRIDRTKGLHILIEALASITNLPVTLDIYGIIQPGSTDPYLNELSNLAKKDSRITFKQSVPSTQVMFTLSQYDLLAVPSQLLETGPLVVLEAFAAGIPVIGSRLGGIAELIEDGVNGVLVEPSSIQDWANTITQLCLDRAQIQELRAGISSPPSMQSVSTQMTSIYRNAINKIKHESQNSRENQKLQSNL